MSHHHSYYVTSSFILHNQDRASERARARELYYATVSLVCVCAGKEGGGGRGAKEPVFVCPGVRVRRRRKLEEDGLFAMHSVSVSIESE